MPRSWPTHRLWPRRSPTCYRKFDRRFDIAVDLGDGLLADAQALAEKIANLPLVIAAKAEEGRIFGAITAADLAEALAAKGIEIDRKTIAVENIKTLGEYEAVAKIHRDVKATIKFTVTAEE